MRFTHFRILLFLAAVVACSAQDRGTIMGRVTDPSCAVIAGATLCLGQLLHDQPDRDDAHATDQVTEDLLRMLGVPAAEAHRICLRPLPGPGDPAAH
jgi:hypothetical protein